MNKLSKIFLILIITFLLTNISNQVCAKQVQSTEVLSGIIIGSTTIDPNDYDPSKQPLTESDAAEVVEKVGIILGAIRNISVLVSVIILMVIGFKYIIGSVEEKANYKATMIPYIIGCIMAIAGTTIVSTIYDALN